VPAEPFTGVTLARILRPHGLRGEVSAAIVTDFPERLPRLREVWLSDGRTPPRRVDVQRCRLTSGGGGQAIFHFAGVEDRDAADRLRGLEELGVPLLALVADEGTAAEALAAGAQGALFRDVDGHRLTAALQATALGMVVLDQALAASALRSRPHLTGPGPEPLTPRELEVLQLLSQGLSNKSVADRLGISEHTAKFHVNAILAKLGAQTRTEAVVRAVRLGLVLL